MSQLKRNAANRKVKSPKPRELLLSSPSKFSNFDDLLSVYFDPIQSRARVEHKKGVEIQPSQSVLGSSSVHEPIQYGSKSNTILEPTPDGGKFLSQRHKSTMISPYSGYTSMLQCEDQLKQTLQNFKYIIYIYIYIGRE